MENSGICVIILSVVHSCTQLNSAVNGS